MFKNFVETKNLNMIYLDAESYWHLEQAGINNNVRSLILCLNYGKTFII
jgi:hypothetical protein